MPTGDEIAKKRKTLDDVARLAKVSPITVSRALRMPDAVSPELRARIDAAVHKLAYVPNLAASRLASSRSHSVGVIVPTLYNVIFAEYLLALHEVFLKSGYQVVVVNSRYSALEEEQAIKTLLGQRVEAIIVVGVDHTPMARRLLQQAKIPVIETFELTDDPVDVNIGLSQTGAGQAASEFLIGLGHRKIGFAMGHLDVRAAARLSGYKRAMRGAQLDSENFVTSLAQQSSIALGSAILDVILKKGALPEALFCIDDNVAMGVAMKCRELAIRVPQDISILGFHDLEFAAFGSPPLSTVATHRYEIGKIAAEKTIDRLKGAKQSNSVCVDVGYEIIARESTSKRKGP